MNRPTLFLLSVCMSSISSLAEPRSALPRSSPEAQGISSAAILRFLEAADQTIDTMHSFMLVRHGCVVAEGWWSPYDAATPHELYSLSKSFTSTAVGMAIAEARLSIDDLVLPRFPEDAPVTAGENLKAMRIRDLLCMSTGHHADVVEKFSFASSERLTRQFLAMPVAHKPGTHFVYNTPASYMLSALVQQATSKTLLEYLRPRLFEPLEIEHPTWEASPQGISLGGYGLSIRTEDIACFGQLYLQMGNWRGKQLVPSAWVAAATSRQTANGSNPDSDWEQGYGYQFWRCRHGAYRADGAFGQFCIVLPEQDAVVAITSGTKDMPGVLNLVWDRLLPAFQARPLPGDAAASGRLKHTLEGLEVRPQRGSASSSLAARVSGKRFLFPANDQRVEALALEAGEDGRVTLVARIDGVERRLVCGYEAWPKGEFAYGALRQQIVAASGAWTSEDVYVAKVCFCQTPYYLTFHLRFEGDRLQFDAEYNVSFGATRQPPLTGTAE